MAREPLARIARKAGLDPGEVFGKKPSAPGPPSGVPVRPDLPGLQDKPMPPGRTGTDAPSPPDDRGRPKEADKSDHPSDEVRGGPDEKGLPSSVGPADPPVEHPGLSQPGRAPG